MFFLFFVNQKTAYEMRISDWSSDVCSSDLAGRPLGEGRFLAVLVHVEIHDPVPGDVDDLHLVGRLQPAGIGGRNAFDHVDVAREHRGNAGARVLEDAEGYLVPGGLFTPIVIVALDDDIIVWRPGDEFERAEIGRAAGGE